MAVKHQIEPIGPVYLGGTEINRIYLGTTLVYSTPPYPYSTTDIIDGLGGWNGNYTDLGNDKASVTLDNGNTITIIPSKTYVIFHDPIVDAYFKERLGVTSGEVTLAQFRTLNASTAAFTSAHRPEDYAEVTEFNEYRFLSGTTIPGGGFGSCSAMEEIRIPVSVTVINGGNPGAFNACSSLTTIDLNDTVATLYLYAFSNCTSLESVTGCGNLTTIEAQSFRYCSSLKSLDDWSHIKKINNYAFRNGCDLRGEISLPLIEYMGQNVFAYGNKLLTKVTFGPNLTHFEGNNFAGCTGLEEVDFNGAVLTSIPSNTFNGCTSLTKVTPPTGVTTIGDSAFRGCSSIVSLTGFSNVTSISSNAFRECPLLESIDLSSGNSGLTVGQYAFLCTSAARGSLKSFPFERITWIGPSNENTYNQAFKYQDLTGCVVNMPNLTNTRFYDGVFAYTKIKKVMSLGSTLTTIGDTFTYCSELEEVHLPLTVTTLGGSAFGACSSLVTIDGTDNITSIGTGAFSSCSSLKSISIPLVTSLNSVFQKCGSLEYIELPSITSITVNCFQLCSSLRYADIGPGITTFGVNYAFTSCTSLEYVIIRATTPPTVGAHVFDNTNNCKFYVPYSSDHSVLAAYQSATNWSSYASRMLELDENGDIPS